MSVGFTLSRRPSSSTGSRCSRYGHRELPFDYFCPPPPPNSCKLLLVDLLVLPFQRFLESHHREEIGRVLADSTACAAAQQSDPSLVCAAADLVSLSTGNLHPYDTAEGSHMTAVFDEDMPGSVLVAALVSAIGAVRVPISSSSSKHPSIP